MTPIVSERGQLVRIGFVGLETSHPFTDARNLRALEPTAEFVFDGRPSRCETFAAEHPEATRARGIDEIIAAEPHVVVLSQRPAEVSDAVAALAAARIPTFVNKPAAVTFPQVDSLVRAAAGSEHMLLTGSVLCFAPPIEAVSLEPAAVRSVEIRIRHDVGWWRSPEFAWQAAPEGAGGIVPVMGLHALDVLARLLGPGFSVVSASVWTEKYLDLPGGDHARIGLRLDSGATVTVVLEGVAEEESYEFVFSIVGESRPRRVLLTRGNGEDSFGYVAAARKILDLGRSSPSPRPWSESIAVLRALAQARRFASTAG